MDWHSSDANDNKHGYFLACPLFSKFLGLKQDFPLIMGQFWHMTIDMNAFFFSDQKIVYVW